MQTFCQKKKISIEVLTAFKKEKKFFNRKIKVISLEKNSKIKSRFFKTIITIFLFIKYCKNKDSLILSIDSKSRTLNLSVKALEIQDEKEALSIYGYSASGASLGDILGEALNNKNSALCLNQK